MCKNKATGKLSFFDDEKAARKLSETGNPLVRLDSVIDFEMLRRLREEAMVNCYTKNNAGAKLYVVVMMFKVTVLHQYYNLSYEQTDYRIIERSRFKQSLGLASGDTAPHENTIRNMFDYQFKILKK